jgi:outer membrane protein assembly factor BamB
LTLSVGPLAADEWPQWRGPTRNDEWKETGIVEKFSGPQIPIRWRAPVGGGFSGPTVAAGRVYVTDFQPEPNPVERVLCFDWETGRRLWDFSYDCDYERVGYASGPRAAVSIDDGRAYALGTMGHFHCLDAATGKLLWKKVPGVDYKIRVPIWGMTSAPLVDGDLVIVQLGAEGACLVAFDKKTGAERWRALDDKPSYSAPIIIQQAGRRVLLCWTGDNAVGLDPASGKVFWKYPFPPAKMVINVPTPVLSGERLFLTGFYDGSLMLKLAQDELRVEKLWRRKGASEQKTDALHAMISTPYMEGDHIYGVDSYGELRCLDARTGDRIWEDLTAVPKNRWATIHMVRNGQRMFMFNDRGELLIGTLSPQGFHEISRAKLIAPTNDQFKSRGGVCWSHPAYAYKHIFARNDQELVCASLAAENGGVESTAELERLIDAIASRSIPMPKSGDDNRYPASEYPKDYARKEQERVRKAIWTLAEDNSNDLWKHLIAHIDDQRLSIIADWAHEDETGVSRWSVGSICTYVAHAKATCAYLQHLPPLYTRPLGAPQFAADSDPVLSEHAQHFLHRPAPLSGTDFAPWCRARKSKPLYQIQVAMCEWAAKEAENNFAEPNVVAESIPETPKKEFLTAVKHEIESLQKSKKPVVDRTPWASPVSEENLTSGRAR